MLYVISRTVFHFLMLLLFRIRIYKPRRPLRGPFFVVSNHASLIDPPLVGVAMKPLRVGFMAKKELFDMPVIGRWTSGTGCIAVNRQGGGAGSLKEAIKRVKQGHVVGIFPEGSRSFHGEIRPSKQGVGFLVTKARVPVVPVYIRGSGKALGADGLRFRAPVEVYVGDPVPYEELVSGAEGRDAYAQVAERITSYLVALKEKHQDKGARQEGTNGL